MKIELILPLLLVIGLCCQWLAWRIRLPAILFLLLAGLVVGPVTGWVKPDQLFGDLLMPMVSLSVAIILFEGSLTLKIDEIKDVSKVVRRMITVGGLSTWIIVASATYFIFDFSVQISALFGAIMIVTGPTVIVPMLRSVRPTRKIANILRWEGIAIDPIGALMAVLTYEFILTSIEHPAMTHIIGLFLQTVFIGVVIGSAAGFILGRLLSNSVLPEYLQNFATLSLVLLTFSASNSLAHESGLISVTIMGMWLANRTRVDIHPILNFKEHLSLLLISMLFIVLAARLDLNLLAELMWPALLLLAVLQLIARPIKVLICTFGSDVSWPERGLLAWIAPRGIVAAAISAIFADRLIAVGYDEAILLVPLTFAMIIGTVVLQSCTSGFIAKLLGVAAPAPTGFLIVGANSFSRLLAKELTHQGFRCVLADTNSESIRKARMAGLETYYGNPASDHADIHLDLTAVGNLLAMSSQRHLNTVSVIHFRSDFGNENVFRLTTSREKGEKKKLQLAAGYQGLPLFGDQLSYADLVKLADKAATIKTTKLTAEFDWPTFKAKYAGLRIPLFEINAKNVIRPIVDTDEYSPPIGTSVLAIETLAIV